MERYCRFCGQRIYLHTLSIGEGTAWGTLRYRMFLPRTDTRCPDPTAQQFFNLHTPLPLKGVTHHAQQN